MNVVTYSFLCRLSLSSLDTYPGIIDLFLCCLFDKLDYTSYLQQPPICGSRQPHCQFCQYLLGTFLFYCCNPKHNIGIMKFFESGTRSCTRSAPSTCVTVEILTKYVNCEFSKKFLLLLDHTYCLFRKA